MYKIVRKNCEKQMFWYKQYGRAVNHARNQKYIVKGKYIQIKTIKIDC